MKLRSAIYSVAALIALWAAAGASARATVIKETTIVRDLGGLELICPTEKVVIDGTVRITGMTVITPNLRITSHSVQISEDPGGLTAIGQTTGTVYRVHGAETGAVSIPAGTARGADTISSTVNYILVPVGGGPALRFHHTQTTTFDAKGNLVQVTFHADGACA